MDKIIIMDTDIISDLQTCLQCNCAEGSAFFIQTPQDLSLSYRVDARFFFHSPTCSYTPIPAAANSVYGLELSSRANRRVEVYKIEIQIKLRDTDK